MQNIEHIYNDLRNKGYRITGVRKEIITILNGKHLSFDEIRQELIRRNYNNLATLYNSIDFLKDNNIIIEIMINGKKFYDLAIDDYRHNAHNHIHVSCRQNDNIIEINEDRIFDYIRNDPIFKNFSIEQIQIVVKGDFKEGHNKL